MADGRNGKMKILSTPADHRWLVGIVVWEIQKQTSLLYLVHFTFVFSVSGMSNDTSQSRTNQSGLTKTDVTEIKKN
jgi:hypothetical protein